jgi:3-deoxy-D-manno-octulosonate 8-phosphate phosphatase (KDO 8-P phosphatase)
LIFGTKTNFQMLDNFKERLKEIKAFVFDVDGVFSQNVVLQSNGDMLRTMNTKDGFALYHAVNNQSFIVAIITGGYSESVKLRFQAMGLTDVYIKSNNKLDDFEDFISKYNLEPSEVLYMGDDIPDYEVMKTVGIPTCPADAAEEIKSISVYISDKRGGEGCVRDVIEQVLRAQGKWFTL